MSLPLSREYRPMIGIRHPCLWCPDLIIWDGQTWKHPDGSFLKVQCEECGRACDTCLGGADCPVCGVPGALRSHYAVPILDEDRADELRAAVQAQELSAPPLLHTVLEEERAAELSARGTTNKPTYAREPELSA